MNYIDEWWSFNFADPFCDCRLIFNTRIEPHLYLSMYVVPADGWDLPRHIEERMEPSMDSAICL